KLRVGRSKKEISIANERAECLVFEEPGEEFNAEASSSSPEQSSESEEKSPTTTVEIREEDPDEAELSKIKSKTGRVIARRVLKERARIEREILLSQQQQHQQHHHKKEKSQRKDEEE